MYYKKDKEKILYKIISDGNSLVTISGVFYRIIRKVEKSDLIYALDDELKKEYNNLENKKKRLENIKTRSVKYKCGKILHIDGDEDYLNKCMELYRRIGVYAKGVYLDEREIYLKIDDLIKKYTPDIVVITGHDMFDDVKKDDVNSYINTRYFMMACKRVRVNFPNIVIIAGACQSNFEALIASGADFASSPQRINIHTYDPCVIAIKVATSSINRIVNINEIFKYIENGKDAINGLDTFGKMRLLL